MTIPIEFVLFGLTLLGVAVFHHHTLKVALIGLAAITAYKIFFGDFYGQPGLLGLWFHLLEEWVVLVNLFALLVGFALLSRHFEESHVPHLMPRFLPDDWKGGFTLLAMVFVLSAFLDNIAAAIIGATVAATIYRNNLHIGFLAAIVAASNAGGAGSVVGDTTTTMMWLDGVAPLDVLHAYVASVAAFLVFAIPAARAQQRHSPIVKDPDARIHLDWSRVIIVVLILAGAIAANIHANSLPPEQAGAFPYIGATVIGVILLLTPWRRPDWKAVPPAVSGSVFLLSLVFSASMMPVDQLPPASAITAFGLGFVSAVFDNIPLTKLALEQGGYDWGALAYTVGFGGSMIWFGSSAGVAVSNRFPEAKSVGRWLREGWYVAVGYIVGFAVLMAVLGWIRTRLTTGDVGNTPKFGIGYRYLRLWREAPTFPAESAAMGDTNRIVLALKRALRSRGITYAMLAKRISLSEPSVKRILSRGSLSLPRLERICEATGISLEELIRPVSSAPAETSSTLSAVQETALAADPQLLACFYLMTNGHTPREVATELGVDEKQLRRWLVKLDNLHLVELRARLGARLRVHAPISWRDDGPIRRTYEQQVREEFMRSTFQAPDEVLHFRSAEMSEASRVVLMRKLARLTADFNELAELDRHLPSRDKRSVALMMTCRPWVWSMFDGLRRR